MEPKKRCRNINCRRVLNLNPRVKNHGYCGRKACQGVRKRRWQQQKMTTDPCYKDNQKDAQKKWRAANPGYWRNYRREHTTYCERNRLLQKNRDACRRARHLAKMDALENLNHIKPAGYYYIASTPSDLANMDASIQKVLLIPEGYKNIASSCKKGLDRQPDQLCLRCIAKEDTGDDPSTLPRPSP